MGTKTKTDLLADVRIYLGTGDGAGAGRFTDEALAFYADGELFQLTLDLPEGLLETQGVTYTEASVTPKPTYTTIAKPNVSGWMSPLLRRSDTTVSATWQRKLLMLI